MFKIIGAEKLIKGLERMALAPKRTHALLVKTGMVVEAEAVKNLNAPGGSTTTGRLAQSIVLEDRPADKAVIVGTNVHYAPYVEFGTRPHRPPAAPLKPWARKKLGNERLAYAVAKKIAMQGTKPHPFMRPAIRKGIQYFQAHRREIFR